MSILSFEDLLKYKPKLTDNPIVKIKNNIDKHKLLTSFPYSN